MIPQTVVATESPAFLTSGEVMVELAGPAPLAEAESLTRSYSGDVLNIAVALRRLGVPTAILTKVGDDPFGNYLMSEWAELGVDLRYVSRGGGPTGVYVAEFGPAGHYDIWYYRRHSAASTLAPADVDAIALDGVRLVHVSGISQAISETSRAATFRLVERARAAGIQVSVDVNYRPRLWKPAEAAVALREILPFIDIVFCGAPDESEAVSGFADPVAAGAFFLDQGATVAALSMAADGCYVAWADGSTRLPHVARRVEHAQGAGDAFAGGFARAWIAGALPETCARLATVTAGLKVERTGALLGLPWRDEVVVRARELGWTDAADVLD